MSSLLVSEEVQCLMIPNHLIIKMLDFPSLLITNKAVRKSIKDSLFHIKQVLHFERKFEDISKKWYIDIVRIKQWKSGLMSLNDNEKKDILKSHESCPWYKYLGDILSDVKNGKMCCFKKCYRLYFKDKNIDLKRFIYVVWLKNIDLALYYYKKNIFYETPENIAKRRKAYMNVSILSRIFFDTIKWNSEKMMSFIWDITPDPYLDLITEFHLHTKKSNRILFAEFLCKKEWIYENELNIIDFLRFTEEINCLNIYEFLLDKKDCIDILDYKKIITLAFEKGSFGIYQYISKELKLIIQ
jgi:hypothetical protein